MTYKPAPSLTGVLGGIIDLLPQAIKIPRQLEFRRKPKAFVTLPDGELYFDSRLQLDTDGWPGSTGKADPTHQAQTSLRYKDGSSVNANLVPYFVLPQPVENMKVLGIRIGAYGVILHDGNWTPAVFADFGGEDSLGEASLAVFRTFGEERIRPDGSVHDVDMGPDIVTIVFPGTSRGNRYFASEAELLSDLTSVATEKFKALRGRMAPAAVG